MRRKGSTMSIKLINGDCFEVLKQLPDKIFDVTFTSPPYNRKRNDKYANYDDTIDDYYQFLVDAINLCRAKTKRYVIFNVAANYYNREEVYRLIGHFSKDIKNIVIWEKSNPVPASGNNITSAYEFFFILSDGPVKSNVTYTKNHITTSVNSEFTTKIHKAVMKQDVADWFVEHFALRGDAILDPFMGLGTTGLSCKKYGISFTGIEKDQMYYDIASQRIKESAKCV